MSRAFGAALILLYSANSGDPGTTDSIPTSANTSPVAEISPTSDAAAALIFKPEQGVSARHILKSHGLHADGLHYLSDNAVRLELTPGKTLPVALKALRDDARTSYVYRDSRVRTIATTGLPDDPLANMQWQNKSSSDSPASLDLYQAWQITHGSADTVVAVIDSGVRYEHPDMTGRLLPGYDFVSSALRANDGDDRDDDATDPGNAVDATFSKQMQQQNLDCPPTHSTWHGTAIASIIAANSSDGYGMAGIDRHARVLPARVTGRCGGSRSDLLDAIRWAAGVEDPNLPTNPTPARIINISLAIDDECSIADQRAVNDAINAGAIIVAGVGNDRRNLDVRPTSPATCDGVLAVAAVASHGELTPYSNYGSAVDLLAPGGDELNDTLFPIVTASNSGRSEAVSLSNHRTYSGTSVAAPMVSGVLSLMLSINPDLTNTELYNLIKASTKTLAGNSTCSTDQCGTGMLNADLAVRNTQAYVGNTLPPEFAAAVAAPITTNSISSTGSGSFGANGLFAVTLLLTMTFGWRLTGGAGPGRMRYSAGNTNFPSGRSR